MLCEDGNQDALGSQCLVVDFVAILLGEIYVCLFESPAPCVVQLRVLTFPVENKGLQRYLHETLV